MKKPNSTVVSLRSKGLASFNKQTVLDTKNHATNFALDAIDVLLSAIITVLSLSWSAWISIVITIIVVACVPTTHTEYPASGFFLLFAYVVLPLIVLIGFILKRREDALGHLSTVKSLVVAMACHGVDGSLARRGAQEEVRGRVFTLMECLHRYLQHKRPYVQHFFVPWRYQTPRPTDKLLLLSREMGLLLRRVHLAVRDAHVACQRLEALGDPLSEARGALMTQMMTQLHEAVEGLVSVKEMRTPVTLRAVIRWYTIVIIPVFIGPFINFIRFLLNGDNVMAGTVGVMSHIALMVLLDVFVGMEDPFDDKALDNISLYEMMDHISAMTSEADDAGADAAEGHVVVPAMSRGPLNPAAAGQSGDDPSGSSDAQGEATSRHDGAGRYTTIELPNPHGMVMPPMPLPPMHSAVGNGLMGVGGMRWPDT